MEKGKYSFSSHPQHIPTHTQVLLLCFSPPLFRFVCVSQRFGFLNPPRVQGCAKLADGTYDSFFPSTVGLLAFGASPNEEVLDDDVRGALKPSPEPPDPEEPPAIWRESLLEEWVPGKAYVTGRRRPKDKFTTAGDACSGSCRSSARSEVKLRFEGSLDLD